MIQSRNELKFSFSSELISPILSNKLKTDSFISRKNDNLELLELLKNDQLNLKSIHNAQANSKDYCLPISNINRFPLENVSPYCEVSKASLKDNIEELKNIIFTKNIHKKELKTGFLYEEKGLRKLNDIQCKSSNEKLREEIEINKEFIANYNFKSSLKYYKNTKIYNCQRDSFRDVYKKTKVILDNKLSELKNKLLMHNQNLYKILSVNSPEKYPLTTKNKQYFFNDIIKKSSHIGESLKNNKSLNPEKLTLVRNNTTNYIHTRFREKLKIN